MRYRVAEYTISGQTIALPSEVTIEDIRLIVNETQKKVICSSMQKSNVEVNGNSIEVNDKICVLQPADKLTIEIDKGEEIAKEQTLTDGVNTLAGKIDNIQLPEIDTTELAKQGENQEATNTAILEELMKLNGSYADQIKYIVGE